VGNSTKLKFEHFRPFSDFIWLFLSFAPVCVGSSAGEQEKEEK
jgi:hypothetical protein